MWTTNDPGIDFSGTANFVGGGTTYTLARSQGLTGTIDISKFKSGTLYFIYGTYYNPNTVALAMSGAGQPDVFESHTEDPPNDYNRIWISRFDFADTSAYSTISYTYTNTDTDGSRARFMGVIIDGVDPTKAHDPDPRNAAQGVPITGTTLSFKAGLNPATPTVPNPNIIAHYLWLSEPYDAKNPVISNNPWEAPGVRQFTIPADGDNDGGVDPSVFQPITGLQKDKLYLWAVDEGLVGSSGPRETDPGKIIWGDTWRFETELSDEPIASVDAGNDRITWSGKPVQLNAMVVDDHPEQVSYLWSSDAAEGVVFSDETAEDPTVTITSAFLEIPIANAGFEDSLCDDGTYNWDHPGWGWFANEEYVGTWNPPAASYASEAPEGENVGFANPRGVGVPGGFVQILTETLTASATYRLTVEVGNTRGYPWGGYKVQLLAGAVPTEGEVRTGTVLAEDDNTLAVAEGTFMTSTVMYTYDPDLHADLLGEPLQIRLLSGGNVAAGDDTEVDFDNVRLAVKSTAYTVTLTLTATDAVSSLADTMTIDVYEDACQVAIAAGLAPDPSGDLDGDCLTDFKDAAVMAATWLVEYALTEAAVK